MDNTIYSKLPSGGSLWNFNSPYVDKYIQKSYDNPNIEQVIQKEKLQIKKQFVQKERKYHQTLINFIILTVDPLASLYTRPMFEQAENILKERLTEIISKGPIYQWLGPKKSRTLMAWITRNNHGVIYVTYNNKMFIIKN